MDTDDFIEDLAADAQPIRRLEQPWFRACVWLALGLSPVLLMAVVDGLPVEQAFVDRQSIVDLGAAIATAAAAAISALAATIPGASKRWLLLPLVPLAVWLSSVEEVCVPSWMRFAFENLGRRPVMAALR